MLALYGDTDSIFIENGALPENQHKLEEFIKEAEVKLNGLEISKENSLKLIVFVENKK